MWPSSVASVVSMRCAPPEKDLNHRAHRAHREHGDKKKKTPLKFEWIMKTRKVTIAAKF